MKKHPLPEEQPRYLNARGILHIYEGQTAKAIEVFRQLLESYRDECILRLNFGISLCAAGKNYDGIIQARMAARKDPNHSKCWNRLGYLYIAAGRVEDALACFKESIRLRPNEAGFHESLAVCYHLLNWTEQALSELEHINDLDQPPRLFNDIYRVAIMGSPQEASNMLRAAVRDGNLPLLAVSRNPNINLVLDSDIVFKRNRKLHEN